MNDRDPLVFRRSLRRASTDAERQLWRALKAKRLAGTKFRRQHSVGPYVIDFYCPAARLGVEADGGQHFTPEGKAHDARRDGYLARCGVMMLRFTDREILLEKEQVVETIWRAVQRRLRRV